MFELQPDRMMLFFDSADGDWVVLRLVAFHYTIFKTDILDILEIADIEIPKWLEYVLKVAQKAESRPIPEAPFPQSLPSLNTLLNIIPTTIESGMSFPVFDGFQIGGLAVNPGGEPATWQPYFKSNLCDLTYKGLNFWAQSGTLNACLCFVSQALLHYRRATQDKILYPLLDITGYLPGRPVQGARVWYVPGLQSQGFGTAESGFAHNEIIFYPGSGQYYINRYIFTDCPVPSFPVGHFLRPNPGQKLKLSTSFGVLGRMRLCIEDDYQAGDSLDTVPYGCYPGWPSDDFLATYNMTNDDSTNLNSLSDIIALPGRTTFFGEHATDNVNYGDVVVDLTEGGNNEVFTGFSPSLLIVAAWIEKNKKKVGLTGINNQKLSTIGGEPLTIAGKRVLI